MMTLPHPRGLAGAVSVAALCAAFLLPEAAATVGPGPSGGCGPTTLDGRVVQTDGGRLRCASGQPLVVRDDLARPGAVRASQRDGLLAFLALADMNTVDEESPLRREWADKCGDAATNGSFRPHETMIPALVNSLVKGASAIASNPTGSPLVHTSYSFAVQLGDAVDNQQHNELHTMIDILDGGKLVDPDTGANGYEGVQATDPEGGSPPLKSPVSKSMLEIANDPFVAAGLRTVGGAPLPWYAIPGTHDIKVQGSIPDDNEGWRTFARAWVTGQIKITDLPPDQQQRVCDDPDVVSDPAFWTAVASRPGAAKQVTADAMRALLDRSEWIQTHFETSGLPAGHGLGHGRCTDAKGKTLARACYAWDQSPFRFIALDTAPSEGLDGGNIDEPQFRWLERELKRNSSRYFDAGGKKKTALNADRLIVVFTHHSSDTTDNSSAPNGETIYDGKALEALLLRFPTVILHANGHAHRNRILPHRDAENRTAYWEVSTSAVADWPSQGRSIEIADNHDGTLSIFGVLFDAAAPPDPRDLSWATDPTDERALGAARAVNEDWLAAAAREVAFHDPQRPPGAAGGEDDRNVELLLPNPFGVTPPTRGGIVPPPTSGGFPPPTFGPFPGFQPPTGFPGGFPPGFPGSFPGQQNPFPPGFPTPGVPQPQTFFGTSAGLPVKPGDGASFLFGARATLMLLAAAAGAYWLLQARVRRWMIGI